MTNPNVASGKAWRNKDTGCIVQIMHLYRPQYGELAVRVLDLSTNREKSILAEDFERDYKYMDYNELLQIVSLSERGWV